jgi:hypothetical protein
MNGSLFYDAFSVTRLHSVDDRVNDDELTKTNVHALSGIHAHDLSDQASKAYASDRVAIGTDYIC